VAEVFALIGAQWGSEGKGVIAAALAHHFRAAVRVGGPNAGHSFYYGGQKWVARSVPCGWINPDTQLLFGAGGVLFPKQLEEEIATLPDRVTIVVDPRAAVILEEYEHRELATIREKIGSTAEGVGLARIAKLARDGSATLAGDWIWNTDRIEILPVWEILDDIMFDEGMVFLEGTQGSGLSLDHGTKYPFATSSDTNVSGLYSAVGLAPDFCGHTQLVARSYPIRVAGNSGPMGEETTWEALGVAPEITTVTKKVRRVSRWDDEVFAKAIFLNQPCGVWLTFADYLDPSIAGSRDAKAIMASVPVNAFVDMIEREFDVPVVGISTGGTGWSVTTVAPCMHDVWFDTKYTYNEPLR